MSAAEKKFQFPVYVLISHGDEVIFEKTFESLPVTIGRSGHCDITLSQFNWISRQHAIITPEGGRIYLVDLKSSNGIQLGGRTYDRVEVHNGTIASIGPLVLQFGLPLEKKAQARGAVTQAPHPSPVDVCPTPVDDDKTMITYDSSGNPTGGSKKGRTYQELDQESLQQDTPEPTPDQFQFVPTNTATGVGVEPPQPPRGIPNSEATVVDQAPPIGHGQQNQQDYQPNFEMQNSPQPPPQGRPQQAGSFGGSSPAKPAPYYMREEIRPQSSQSSAQASSRSAQASSRSAQAHSQPVDGLTGYVLERDKPFDGIDRVPRGRRVLEAYVTWKGEILDTHLFWPGDKVVVGRTGEGLYVPTLKGEFLVADFDGSVARCSIPQRVNGFLRTGDYRPVPLDDLIKSQALARKGKNYVLKLGSSDLCSMQLGNDIQLYFRYAPAPRQLSRKKIVEPDALLKKTITGSGLIHFLIVMICILFAPKQDTPKVKNLPPRIAKLLIKKEKPKPKPKPKKKKEEKKVTKKKTKKKVQKKVVKPKPRKPKKVVVRKNKKIREMNKKVTKNVGTKKPVKGKPTKDLTKVGALAALGALGAATPNPSNKPVSININKNAGGGGSKVTTSGVIGAIKAKGGQLQAAGIGGVKTKGKGFGTGTGYGVQGIKGRAGSRGVAGSVVGSPSLMKIKRTEGLNRKQVMDIVKNYLGEIQQCYERSLLTAPGIAGRVEYEWFITPKGRVKWSKVKKSEMRGGDALNSCVLAIFKKMKFPVAKNGESTRPNIGFPFGRL